MSKGKIFTSPQSLCAHIEECRARGLTVVTANGCFELIHVGHVRYLQEAKSLGDILIVAVNTDASMKAIKPDRNPVNPDVERMEIIAALRGIDYVTSFPEATAGPLIEALKPDLQVKGTDRDLDTVPEREIVERHGGRIVFCGDPKTHSSRELLRRLREDPTTRDS